MKRYNFKYLMELLLVVTISAVVVFGITCGAFQLKKKLKKFNYAIFYKSQVEQTVRDMVKEECLKEEQK